MERSWRRRRFEWQEREEGKCRHKNSVYIDPIEEFGVQNKRECYRVRRGR